MSIASITIDMGDNAPITIETGKIALLAGGSVTVRQGDSVVLCAACSGGRREGMDFFPLQVSYREKYTATGRFPGGYMKREGTFRARDFDLENDGSSYSTPFP